MEKVVITIKTKGPGADGEEFTREFVGDYYRQGEHEYIIYTDEVEETKDTIKTMMKFCKNYLKVVRSGALRQSQEFTPGSARNSDYVTDFGSLTMRHETRLLKIEDRGHKNIKLAFDLYISGEYQGIMDLDIKIMPVQ